MSESFTRGAFTITADKGPMRCVIVTGIGSSVRTHQIWTVKITHNGRPMVWARGHSREEALWYLEKALRQKVLEMLAFRKRAL